MVTPRPAAAAAAATPDATGRRIAVLTVGETMAVVAPAVAEPLADAAAFRLGTAGAESNVAAYLADDGHVVAWASRVGDDALGRRITGQLRAQGIELAWLRVDPLAPTGVMFKDPGEAGTEVLYYRAGSAASRMGPALADELPWPELRMLHLSGITAALSTSCRDLLSALFARAAREHVPVSFDVNYRPRLWPAAEAATVLRELAERAEYVFVGLDEAQALWPGLVCAADVRALLPGPRHLVVKDGAVGAHDFSSGPAVFVPAPVLTVVEAVGAGDAFAAGYLSALLDGGDVASRLGRGHALAGRALASTSDFQAKADRA